MGKLKGSDRKYLKSLAHHLKPVVQIGKSGVTDGLIHTVDQALDTHELIKVKFIEQKEKKRAHSDEIARKTKSHGVGMIGHIAIFYRQHPDAEKRKIHLPSD